MTKSQLSSWQKTKLKHKIGQKKKEIEDHFGIKTAKVSTKEFKEVIKDVQVPLKKTKKKKSK